VIVEGAIVDFDAPEKPADHIKFYQNKDRSVWGTVHAAWAERNEQLGTSNNVIEVPTINFADVVRKYGMPYYLKTDIEGMDTICLKAILSFEQKPAYISIESEKRSFESLLEEFRLFEQLGYRSYQLVNQSKIQSFKEPNNSTEGNNVDYQFQMGSSGLFGQDLSPNNWLNKNEAIAQYKKNFDGYAKYGDNSHFNHSTLGRFYLKCLGKFFGIPVWYDTHARLT
jgi:hypothetical protein